MPMELILHTEQVTIPQAIENIQYLRNELKVQLEYYNSLIVTEDSIKDAKSDKAALNKLKAAIDNQRKEIKKQTLALYEPLEHECKELIAMIDAPIEAIDKQLKAFDDIKKQEKYAAIVEFFGKINCLDFVKLDHVLNPKWGNATMKLDAIKQEISAEVQRISDDYAEIRKLYADSPMLTAIMQRFETTRDKGAALAYAAEIERKERAEQERREREAAERAEREKQIIVPEKVYTDEPIPPLAPADPIIIEMPEPEPEPIGTAAFRVTGTRAQIRALAAYMKENGISYEVIK